MVDAASFKAFLMASPSYPRRTAGFDNPAQESPTPAQSAGYTHDMLVSLGRIAAFHKQAKLALLIGVAAEEARAILANGTNET